MMDWAPEYFERGYAQRWTLGPPSAETQGEADALWTLLGLTHKARVLDVGCGHGRFAVPLAQRGAHVIGVDFASQLLVRAQELAEAFQVTACWVRGDMRCLPFRRESVRATILFDAFGFFEREEENDSVLGELARVLAPGGRAALKVANAEPILANFRPTEREQRGDTTVETERTLLTNPPRLIEDLAVSGPRGTGRYQRRQRLYRLREMTASMEVAGLGVIAVLAAATGAPFEPGSSATMVIIGERRIV